jgi:release factor glutamine methyltransferase
MSLTITAALATAHRLRTVSDSWRLETEILLAAALDKQRDYLYTWPETELSHEQVQNFEQTMKRRGQGEPISYLLGKQEFWDIELLVNKDVLIPRPETELLVESAIALYKDRAAESLRVADLGTGSGAIALALAKTFPAWRVTAIDASAAALAVAQANSLRLELTNVEFKRASWCDGFDADQFDLIVSNPPYVAPDDAHLQQGDLRFEPSTSLISEEGGLADIKKIIDQSSAHLKEDAWLLLEHGYNQAADVQRIFTEAGFHKQLCRQDLAGLDRMTQAQWCN